jgi:hypothetical protein
MQFGLYAPVPHVTVGSPEIDASVRGALSPLPPGVADPAYELTHDVLRAADRVGFDIVLFAERHLGADMEAWLLAAAIAAQTTRIKSMVAVHPGLWHPMMIAKMASTLDRIAKGRMGKAVRSRRATQCQFARLTRTIGQCHLTATMRQDKGLGLGQGEWPLVACRRSILGFQRIAFAHVFGLQIVNQRNEKAPKQPNGK